MNKNIKYLVEDLFTDLYPAIQVIGNLRYVNNDPIGLCCGDAKQFSDKNYRYLFYKGDICLIKNKWSKIPVYLENIGRHDKNDENGFRNTQTLDREYYAKDQPIFYDGFLLNKDCYIPSIKELYYCFKNLKSFIQFPEGFYFSSSQIRELYVYGIEYKNNKIRIVALQKDKIYYALPFIKINI